MKKHLVISALLVVSSMFAGEEIVVNGTVRLGVNTFTLGMGVNTLSEQKIKHPDSLPAMIDVIRDGKSCLVLVEVERYGLISSSRDIAKVSTITCEGEKPKNETGWIYDENGNLGVSQILSGTKVMVAFKPNSNLTYSFK